MSRTIKLAALPVALLSAGLLSIGTLSISLMSISALAQSAAPASGSHPSFFQHMLQTMDTNGDGKISLDEYVAAASARFKSIDTQNKGSINAADIAASPEVVQRDQKMAEFMVKHFDTAGNGYITQDEFLAAAKTRFAKLDKTGTGELTASELTARGWGLAGHAAMQAMALQTTTNGQHAQFAQKRAQRVFDKLDTNHDGVVTQDEYLAGAAAQFKKLDTQGNGHVTAQEIAASPQTLRRDEFAARREIRHLGGTDGSSSISQAQYLTAAKARFAKLDTNGDGFIEANEMPMHHWAQRSQPVPSGN